MGPTCRCGVSGDTALQIGLALLGLFLSALAWIALLAVVARAG
jgi:hypothetical protein